MRGEAARLRGRGSVKSEISVAPALGSLPFRLGQLRRFSSARAVIGRQDQIAQAFLRAIELLRKDLARRFRSRARSASVVRASSMANASA